MLCFDSHWDNVMPPQPEARDLDRLFASVAHLQAFYPQFRPWFCGKVVAGLASGSRALLSVHAGSTLTAIAILKREPDERKICTFWVAPRARKLGVGTRLLHDSLTWLDCDRPLITVCQERVGELQPLLRKFDFTLEQVCDSSYRPGRLEYVFNGSAVQSEDAFQRLDISTLHLEGWTPAAFGLPSGRVNL